MSGSAWPHLEKEIALLRQGYRFIAGLDEAGRGAWAGPVVAAAVILPIDSSNIVHTLSAVHDSKRLTPNKRDKLFEIIDKNALAISVGIATAPMVDELNVVGATRHAMQQALDKLSLTPDYLLLDHLTLPAIDLPQDAFPKADSTSLTVAAASIIAKVTRDRLMVDFNQTYPSYAFDRHKGYGTKLHQAALAQYGPCPLHRMSFNPLKVFSDS